MKRILMAAGLAVAALCAASAMDFEAVSGRFGVAIVNNASDLGAASPVVNTLGGSAILSFSKGFFLSLQPGLDIFWTNYEWNSGRAVPTEAETGGGNNAFVVGLLLDVPLTATVRFNERLGGAASLGTSFLLRAAFASDITDENLSSIASYLWSSGRWFYPSASLRFDVYLQQNFTFAMGVRGFLPVFNAWSGNDNFWDEGILHVTMAMLVGLQ